MTSSKSFNKSIMTITIGQMKEKITSYPDYVVIPQHLRDEILGDINKHNKSDDNSLFYDVVLHVMDECSSYLMIIAICCPHLIREAV